MNSCMNSRYSGEELNQFRFACHTDYKHFHADEQQMLTKTSKPIRPNL